MDSKTVVKASKTEEAKESLTRLPFEPVTKSHILHCSYHYWYPLYRSQTPKARIIPLTANFLEYLREDGIVLPSDGDEPEPTWNDEDSGVFSEEKSDDEDDDALLDPSIHFREVHQQIKDTIAELDGRVAPKLNWSAPKDALWIAATNSLECWRPSDIYLLLKSSNFITHDLEYPFADCVDEPNQKPLTIEDIPYHLVLRKYLNFNPSVEFRCFVKNKTVIGICQRDLNHFDFLFPMVESLRESILSFFIKRLKSTFPDDNYTFDVYLPPPHKRVWLIDINPWAPRTDPILFSWLELLQLDIPALTAPNEKGNDASLESQKESEAQPTEPRLHTNEHSHFVPEFRLIKKDDPEAYGFTAPQYSAHKLPRDVVDAANDGPGGMREFVNDWNALQQKRKEQEEEEESE